MGRAGTIARRTFLIGSAAVAGGVVFGIYASKADANPLLEDSKTASRAQPLRPDRRER